MVLILYKQYISQGLVRLQSEKRTVRVHLLITPSRPNETTPISSDIQATAMIGAFWPSRAVSTLLGICHIRIVRSLHITANRSPSELNEI